MDDAHVICGESHEHLDHIIFRLILQQVATIQEEFIVSPLHLEAELQMLWQLDYQLGHARLSQAVAARADHTLGVGGIAD